MRNLGRHRLAAAAGAGVLLAAVPLAAWAATPATPTATTPGTPAPPGSSEGSALVVGSQPSPLVAVSHTKAGAGQHHSSATANVVELNGKPLAGQFGGSADTANGSSDHHHGYLLDTNDILGKTSPIRLQVTPWEANADTAADGSSTAEGKAAVARANLGDPGSANSVTLDLLQSDSKAAYDNSGATSSTSNTSTDGAVLNVGNGALLVDLLHSDASTSATGTPGSSSYIASINGNKIGTSNDVGTLCKNLNIPGLLGLNCVSATGGLGSNGVPAATSQVLGATVGGGAPGQTGSAFNASGSGGSGATVQAAVIARGPSGTGAVAAAPAGNATPAPHGKLPFTGGPIGFMALVAVALLGLGAVIVRLANLAVPALLD